MKDIKNNELMQIGSTEISLNHLVQAEELRSLINQCQEFNLSAVASKATYDPGTKILTFEDVKIGMNIVPK